MFLIYVLSITRIPHFVNSNYYYFIDMANDVLIESLKRLAPSHVMLDLDFLTFKLSVVNINVILILLLGILSLFIPMLKIRKIKPVKIIKTKE